MLLDGVFFFVFRLDGEFTASEYLDELDEMTRLFDISCNGIKTRSLAFLGNLSDLIKSCPEVDDFCHMGKVHVGKLLFILTREDIIGLEIIQRPKIIHN
jgi:hypothetical protein